MPSCATRPGPGATTTSEACPWWRSNRRVVERPRSEVEVTTIVVEASSVAALEVVGAPDDVDRDPWSSSTRATAGAVAAGVVAGRAAPAYAPIAAAEPGRSSTTATSGRGHDQERATRCPRSHLIGPHPPRGQLVVEPEQGARLRRRWPGARRRGRRRRGRPLRRSAGPARVRRGQQRGDLVGGGARAGPRAGRARPGVRPGPGTRRPRPRSTGRPRAPPRPRRRSSPAEGRSAAAPPARSARGRRSRRDPGEHQDQPHRRAAAPTTIVTSAVSPEDRDAASTPPRNSRPQPVDAAAPRGPCWWYSPWMSSWRNSRRPSSPEGFSGGPGRRITTSIRRAGSRPGVSSSTSYASLRMRWST